MNDKNTAENKFIEFLSGLPLATLRVLGRHYGMSKSTAVQKEKLVETLASILAGTTAPPPRTNRGAPAKQSYIDPEILASIEKIKKENLAPSALAVASADARERGQMAGILEITPAGYGFLRANNCQPSLDGDVFIPAPTIHAMRLREGDFIVCNATKRAKGDSAAISEIYSVNGLAVGEYEKRPSFDSLTAQYATEKIRLSQDCNATALRMLDLFVPIGKGQRALIIAPPKAGKTTLLKTIAGAISEHHREICLIILLIDERPEEVTDIRRSVENAEVVYSTFDEGAEHHIRAAEMTLAHAKRLAELGKDVVILLDSLTKLTRAYNYIVESTGKTLTGGLDAGAFAEPKRFFGAARNTVEAGSLTILATALVETGSRMDDIIYEEFKGTGNADIFLSRDLAERRIFPAIDIRRSGTRKEELLSTEEELTAVYKMRERGLSDNVAGIIDMLKKTDSNEEFIARLPEWMKIFKTSI